MFPFNKTRSARRVPQAGQGYPVVVWNMQGNTDNAYPAIMIMARYAYLFLVPTMRAEVKTLICFATVPDSSFLLHP